jgi:hypothetical protein
MTFSSNHEEIAAIAQRAATDKAQVTTRTELAKFTAATFTKVGEELHAVGHTFGDDRVSGSSPYGHGNDELVAVSLLFRIGGQLTSATVDLFSDGRHYAAAALLRQMVEIEYLAWAFESRDKDAERWLRSDADERRNFFTPAKLRQAANGKFRGKDYGYHCELGGHPVPGSSILLRHDEVTCQLLLSDLLGHTGRIWDHLLGWSAGNEWATPIQHHKKEMFKRYDAWKKLDELTLLPPPP